MKTKENAKVAKEEREKTELNAEEISQNQNKIMVPSAFQRSVLWRTGY